MVERLRDGVPFSAVFPKQKNGNNNDKIQIKNTENVTNLIKIQHFSQEFQKMHHIDTRFYVFCISTISVF